jgi:acyl carrier protein
MPAGMELALCRPLTPICPPPSSCLRKRRVAHERLRLDARTDELDIESLDLAAALFEIEARSGVELIESAAGMPPPTVGELEQQVLAHQAQRLAVPGGA